MVDWAVDEARHHSMGVVVVVPDGQVHEDFEVAGGSTRSESVRRGLSAVPDEATIICVHDAARPFASATVYQRVIGAVVDGNDGAVPGVAVTDTIKQVNSSDVVIETPQRATLRAVQTPQAFRASTLRRAHESGAEGTDDAALVEAIGGTVLVVQGDELNRKITTRDDLDWARAHAHDQLFGEV